MVVALSTEAASPAVQWVQAPVRRVTLFEDRAQVVREGSVALPKGTHRLTVDGVAPVLADRTLVARAPALRVNEARVRRAFRIGASERPEVAAALQKELQRLTAALERRRSLHAALQARRALTDTAADLLVDSVQRELPFAEAFDERWPRDLDAVTSLIRTLDEEIDLSKRDLDDLVSKRAVAELRLAEQSRPDHVLTTAIELSVTAEASGTYAFSLQYLVPCALWRPIHRARLVQDSVRFECEAALWQATGEDWSDVELCVSTARPRQRSEPPVLRDDVLQVARRASREVEVAMRDQDIATTGEGLGAGGAPELPGVDDGGEVRLLGAPAKATVASDGRLRRVPLFGFDAPAEVDRVARPERSPRVYLRSRQTNAAPHPILAGPVELLRESGIVGRTSVGFVAPGEVFALSFGADDALRVRRDVSERRDTGRVTGKLTISRTVELYLSNLEDRPASFLLEERIPVSEIEAVRVRLGAETEPSATADAQGIVAWKVSLPSRGVQKVRFEYEVTASSDVQGL
jgi:uncharacterized protein (TIGR02231 family)